MAPGILLTRSEKRSIGRSALVRVSTTPLTAFAGLLVAYLQLSFAGPSQYALVAVVSTLPLLFSFSDLGLGAPVMSAYAKWLTDREVAERTARAALRLLALVALVIVALSLIAAATQLWPALLGLDVSGPGGWIVSGGVGLFALSIPFSLGARILSGIGRNAISALLPAIATGTSLAWTGVVVGLDAPAVALCLAVPGGFAVSAIVGFLIAMRATHGWRSVVRNSWLRQPARGLLRGSGAALIVAIGLPLGLQSGRIILAHFSTPDEVAVFSLALQLYGVAWSVISVSGLALWPIFTRRQDNSSDSMRLWWRFTALLGGVGLLALPAFAFGLPLFTVIVSGGQLTASLLVGGATGLLFLGQCLHLTSGMMFTRPRELSWQAYCVGAMAIASVTLGTLLATTFGAAGVACAAASGVIFAQFLPDVVWKGVLLGRRTRTVGEWEEAKS